MSYSLGTLVSFLKHVVNFTSLFSEVKLHLLIFFVIYIFLLLKYMYDK